MEESFRFTKIIPSYFNFNNRRRIDDSGDIDAIMRDFNNVTTISLSKKSFISQCAGNAEVSYDYSTADPNGEDDSG